MLPLRDKIKKKLLKRPLKKPSLKKPKNIYYLTQNKSKLQELPDEIVRNIYKFILPLNDIKGTLGLWCDTCGEYIPDYETCIEEINNCYNYTQISNYEKNTYSKLHCLQCFISEIYPEWDISANSTRCNTSLGQITIL